MSDEISELKDENTILKKKLSEIEAENVRLSNVDEENRRKISILEKENADFRQLLSDSGIENKRTRDRLAEVTRGVTKLIEQIRDMGHEPAYLFQTNDTQEE